MTLPRYAHFRLAAFVTLLAAPAHAQLVTPKTVPVFQDEQFAIYPSSRPALSLPIAFDDTLADPFSNPAKAGRLKGFVLTVAPYSHAISGNGGGGQTFPVGVLGRAGGWSGAFFGAMQQLDRGGSVWNRPTSDRTATNSYVTAVLSRQINASLSVGAGVSHSDLRAVDGVDLLYAGSDRIDQSGRTDDYRLGATFAGARGQVLEFVGVTNRTSMRHDVHFTNRVWDTVGRVIVTTARQDVTLDQTNIWGLHSQYSMPVGREGWRIGALATANHLTHPKIPNYVLQNLPRDPGTTNAFNVGAGAVRTAEGTTFGLNVILEPMASDTWADAATPTTRTDFTVIPAGDKTVENHFVFRNGKVAMGLGHTWALRHPGEGVTADFGLTMNRIDYELTQTNNITRSVRNQHESWVEKGPSLGMRYRNSEFEVAYSWRATCGTSSCDLLPSFGGAGNTVVPTSATTSGTIIAAPASPLFIRSGTETSHHLIISVPIR